MTFGVTEGCERTLSLAASRVGRTGRRRDRREREPLSATTETYGPGERTVTAGVPADAEAARSTGVGAPTGPIQSAPTPNFAASSPNACAVAIETPTVTTSPKSMHHSAKSHVR